MSILDILCITGAIGWGIAAIAFTWSLLMGGGIPPIRVDRDGKVIRKGPL